MKNRNNLFAFICLKTVALSLFAFAFAITAQAQPKNPSLKVEMLQIDSVVGDFNGTVKKVLAAYEKAETQGADLVLTPEGILPGYPAWDLYDHDHMIERADAAVDILRQATVGKSAALAVGHITFNPDNKGRRLINVVSIFENGKQIFRQQKALLPTYDVFDDARYFEPGKQAKIFNFRGFRIGLHICESWWYKDTHQGRLIYAKDPIDEFRRKGIDLGISISTSPYYVGKESLRETVHRQALQDLGVPFIYLNSVGGIDQLQMDGQSFVFDARQNLVGHLESFAEDADLVEISKDRSVEPKFLSGKDRNPQELPKQELMLRALMQGLRDYVHKTGQKKVVFGLSGGLDSGVSAAIASLALGPENVIVIMMPSEFSSEGSITDAKASALNLGIPEKNIIITPIKQAYDAFLGTLNQSIAGHQENYGKGNFVPYENLQARIRMIYEMFVSNYFPGVIKLNTSNKSESAMGYGTIYGDISGAVSVIGDLYKTEVISLGYYINQREGREMVPVSTLTKKPSAELRPGQVTENEIPSYDILDPLLEDLIENKMSLADAKARYTPLLEKTHGKDWVEKVARTLSNNEWKREKGILKIKVHRRAFGIGRREPVMGIKYQEMQSADSFLLKAVRCENVFSH